MFKGQHHESKEVLALVLLTLEHAYCKKIPVVTLLRGTFCFTQVQGPNALTTLLHLADVLSSNFGKNTLYIPGSELPVPVDRSTCAFTDLIVYSNGGGNLSIN